MEKETAFSGMKSLSTALRILECFNYRNVELGVGEIANELGLAKSQVSKVLLTFRKHGLVKQDPKTRRYRIGLLAYTIGTQFITNDKLCTEALPIMRSLVSSTGHSTRLSKLYGNDLVYLIGVEGPHFFDTAWRAGTLLPPHATAAGRALLAYLDEAHRDAILDAHGMPSITPYTTVDRERLETELRQCREVGYARVTNQTTIGLGAIACPVLAEDGAAIGTLGMSFPAHLVNEEVEKEIAGTLYQAAKTLSNRMGSLVYPIGSTQHLAEAGDQTARLSQAKR